MIVRISGEDQYKLDDGEAQRLNELENAVVSAVSDGQRDEFTKTFGALLSYVREHGATVPDEELEGSDLILPPADLSFEEAGQEFTGEGLIPD
jgi:hypothetical protein